MADRIKEKLDIQFAELLDALHEAYEQTYTEIRMQAAKLGEVEAIVIEDFQGNKVMGIYVGMRAYMKGERRGDD